LSKNHSYNTEISHFYLSSGHVKNLNFEKKKKPPYKHENFEILNVKSERGYFGGRKKILLGCKSNSLVSLSIHLVDEFFFV
jgi:hypothetical protein